MHYRDGTPALVGDVVFGRGYNVKHPIVGIVLALKEDQSTCNITVATLDGAVKLNETGLAAADYRLAAFHNLTTEYGQADAFELVFRAGVEVPNRFQAVAA